MDTPHLIATLLASLATLSGIVAAVRAALDLHRKSK